MPHRFCCFLWVLLCVGHATAQQSYPQRPIALVVPFAMGGDSGPCALYRQLANSLKTPP